MRTRSAGVMVFAISLAALAFQWPLTAQVPISAKRPLTYDVVDYWKSIQGTRLSDDGQWLAYATTAPGDDGELVVRNLRSGQEYKQVELRLKEHLVRAPTRQVFRGSDTTSQGRGSRRIRIERDIGSLR